MQTAQIVKLALVAAILFALYRLVKSKHGGSGWNVQPYERGIDWEEDEDAENDEDAAEESDYEEDDDGGYDDGGYDDDGDDGDDDDEDEDAEDDDDEFDDRVETFSSAMPAESGSRLPNSSLSMMNVATNLLPKPVKNNPFGQFAPKNLLGQNFLDAKKFIGVDTQGSSMRNANYDLRSSPAIPRRNVGPWGQSTIDADQFRKPLE